jgi:hypothetical protein
VTREEEYNHSVALARDSLLMAAVQLDRALAATEDITDLDSIQEILFGAHAGERFRTRGGKVGLRAARRRVNALMHELTRYQWPVDHA